MFMWVVSLSLSLRLCVNMFSLQLFKRAAAQSSGLGGRPIIVPVRVCLCSLAVFRVFFLAVYCRGTVCGVFSFVLLGFAGRLGL